MQYNSTERSIIMLIVVLVPLVGLGIDIYAPSLPTIMHVMHTSAAYTRISFSSYLIGAGFGQILFGSWSDHYGRRHALISGLSVFIIASILIIFSTNIIVMIGLRCLQGLGVSAVSVVAKSLLTDHFNDQKLKHATATMTTAWAMGPIIAPVLGGYLQHYIGWQANFAFLAIYAIVSLILSYRLPSSPSPSHPFRIQLSPYRQILRHRLFIATILCLGCCYAILIIYNTLAPFFIQHQLQFSAVTYGHVGLLLGVMYFGGSLVNRKLVQFLASATIYAIIFTLMFMASILLFISSSIWPDSLSAFVLPLILLYISAAMLFPNLMSIALGLFRESAGVASACVGCTLFVIASILSSLVSGIHVSSGVSFSLIFFIICIVIFVIYRYLIHPRQNPPS